MILGDGRAYVFERQDGSWNETQILSASDGERGWSDVSLNSTMIAVGAAGDGEAGEGAGSVYIYRRDGTSWDELPEVRGMDTMGDDAFGFRVAMTELSMLVGASRADGTGALYAFERSGDSWYQVAKLPNPTQSAGDNFGESIAVDGDAVVVGAKDVDQPGIPSAGMAIVYRRVQL